MRESKSDRLLMSERVARALLSVSDKTGLAAFAGGLARLGVTLLSTGGTAKALADAGLKVVEIGDYTGFPEMLDGRVKTLHPKVHGGILARRDLPAHAAALEKHAIPTIDLVVVNLYPFRETVAKPGCTLEDAIENIDIGGPAMVRSAAKNWRDVGVVVDPADYAPLLSELETGGALSVATRFALARKAFSHTAAYDGAISNWLTARSPDGAAAAFPDRFNVQAVKVQDLRYGENPHQQAAFYREDPPAAGTISNYRQLQGKELSYNNIADADAAWECVKTFGEPACVIVKHANPCGVAMAASLVDAYQQCLRDRPCVRVRRHHRVQPAGRPADARGRRRAVRRGADRAVVHGGRARRHRAEEERPGARSTGRRQLPGAAARLEARRRRAPRADRGRAQRRALGTPRRDAEGAARLSRGPICCSRGGSRSLSNPTPSSTAGTGERSALAQAR